MNRNGAIRFLISGLGISFIGLVASMLAISYVPQSAYLGSHFWQNFPVVVFVSFGIAYFSQHRKMFSFSMWALLILAGIILVYALQFIFVYIALIASE